MARTLWIGFTATLLIISLSSCTTITPPPSPVPPAAQKPWPDREAALTHLQNWQLNGKIAVVTANDSGSATVDWVQNQKHFNISLLGPLGTNGLKLSGQPGLVTLETADGKHFTAKSPEQLLAQQWGWNVPVSNLNYWVRGLPVPGMPHNSQFDAYHRLSNLTQQGWNIQYLGYETIGQLDLPNKIFITSSALRTKIIVYHWKVG